MRIENQNGDFLLLAVSDGKTLGKSRMKVLHAILLFLCLSLVACADRKAGMALGVGSHGASAALFTDNGWLGVGPSSGLMLGFGTTLYGGDSEYSTGQVTYRQPVAGQNASASEQGDWYKAYRYPGPLAAYSMIR
jgi:hypothetical protein